MRVPTLLTSFAAAWHITRSYAAPQVKIGKTTVIGRENTFLKQDFFGGIPFAEPPLGPLRLKPPSLKDHLDTAIFDAPDFGPGCLQPFATIPLSEDCLTINILRPSNPDPNAQLPVLFWVYGGGFETGASSLYNGSAIVAQSVARGTPLIYVNFNYRLGPLGFLQGQEAADKGALNLALKDELTALVWVQRNIAAFGGDKEKVTVFGESAGAIMNSILFLNSPLAKLARGMILQSGSPATPMTFRAAHREGNWEKFVTGVASCSELAPSGHTFDCIQHANTSEMLPAVLYAIDQVPEQFGFDPTIDGPGGLYPDYPSMVFTQGKFPKIPFISGTNLDEGTAFVSTSTSSEADIRAALIANLSRAAISVSELNKAIDQLFRLYPDDPAFGSPFNTGNETFGLSPQFKRHAAIEGDLAFNSQRRILQQTAARAGVKSWGYIFTQPQLPSEVPPFLGVTHRTDVVYVYGMPGGNSSSSARLSKTMIDYWISFATSLDPNDGKGQKRPTWQDFTISDQRIIQLNGDNTTMIPDTFRREQIDFFNSLPSVFDH